MDKGERTYVGMRVSRIESWIMHFQREILQAFFSWSWPKQIKRGEKLGRKTFLEHIILDKKEEK